MRRLRAAAALLTLALTSCTGTATPPVPSPTATTPGTPGTESISMLWWGSEAEQQLLTEQLTEFTQETGTRVEVDVVQPEQADQTITQRTAAGDLPDVMLVNDPTPLRSNAKTLSAEPSNYLAGVSPGAVYQDKTIAVPDAVTVSTTLINADAFANAGIPVPAPGQPWKSWPLMLADANAVAAKSGMAHGLAMDDTPVTLATYFSLAGSPYYDVDGLGVRWKHEAGGVAIDDLEALLNSGQLARENFTGLSDPAATPSQASPSATAEPAASASPSETSSSASPSASHGAPRPTWPAPGPVTARQLFEQGKVPVLITDSSYVPATPFTTRAVSTACQESCGVLPRARWLMASAQAPAEANDLINKLTSTQAQKVRLERTGVLPTRAELLTPESRKTVQSTQRPADTAVFLEELSRITPTAAGTGYSPAFGLASANTRVELMARLNHKQSTKDAVERIGRGVSWAGDLAR